MTTSRPRPGKPLDPALPPRARELAEAMRRLRERAGQPSYRALRARSAAGPGVALTLATLSRVFGPQPSAPDQASLPEWVYYHAVITLLGGDPESYRPLWTAARDEWPRRPITGHGTERAAHTTAVPAGSAPGEPEPGEPASGGYRRRRRRRALLVAVPTAALLLAVVALALSSWLMFTPAKVADVGRPGEGQPVGAQLDGSDPNSTGCTASGALQTYYTHLYADWPRQLEPSAATVTMIYSPTCRTVWATLTGAPPGAVATLHRDSDGRELSCRAGADGACTTAQLNDAGVTSHAFARAPGVFGRTRSH